MAKILGLDLGTNSIGWAIVNRNDNQFELINKGVHIFSEGVKIEKGKESSKAAERTKYRSARRTKFRRKLRKIETLGVLIKHNMCPLSPEELQGWRINKKAYPKNQEFLKWLKTDEATNANPYFFRDKASREKIALKDLGRAFYHISQRRGFLSNRLDQGDDGLMDQIRKELLDIVGGETDRDELNASIKFILESYADEDDKVVNKFLNSFEKNRKTNELKPVEELKELLIKFLNRTENLGKVKKGIAVLSQKMEKESCETLGQYFYTCYKKNEKIRIQYTDREEHYLKEFEIICEVQKLALPVRKELENAIFYQRPLKSQRGLVGKCSFEKNKPRCPISHPSYEEFRALQFINSIRCNGDPLNKEQRKDIWHLFVRKSKPNFDFMEIRKDLTPKGIELKFNYSDRTNVSGCPTIAQLSQKNTFGEHWKESIYEKYIAKKTKIGIKSTDDVINDIWHVLFSFDKDEKLEVFGKNKLGLNTQQARKFSKITLKKEYSSLSLKAITKILPYLREGLIYSYAVFLANIEKVIGNEIWSDIENQKFIRSELNNLIENYNEIRKRESVVNDLMAHFKKDYNNADSDYVLDKKDKSEVIEKIQAVYGKKHFGSIEVNQQAELVIWVETKYQEQLRKNRGEFIRTDRLDEKIASFLQDNFNVSNESLEKLYHPSDIDVFKEAKISEDGKYYLNSPMIPSIKNPMAMRTMHQLRKLVNTLINEGEIEKETKIHIELARELNDANKRKAIQDWQKDRQEERENAKSEIIKLYKEQCGKDIEPSQDDILKYILWEEQDHKCLYTDNPSNSIGICDFIGPNPKYDLEHTIPKSLSFDNSQENLTLCEVSFNREIKRNKIPAELPNHSNILERLVKWEQKTSEYEKLFNSRKRARGIEAKEQKDKRIREKHYYKLYLDYWKGKYSRFIRKDVPEGFKNSQLVDTGIITKYARAYLKSVFFQVYSVKGGMVKEFRELWGLQEAYSKKERANHIHHCIDAITIACMTKDKYDLLSKLYHADEEGYQKEKKEMLQIIKPWTTFTEDIKAIEKQVLVSHHTPDNVKKQAKKKSRIRGKIEYGKDEKPIYQKGDTVRGSLHKETFYGAIIKPYQKEDLTPKYVIRMKIEDLKASDVKNIVDPVIQRIIQEAVDGKGLIQAVKDGLFMASGVSIKKVRCYAPTVASPIFLKPHRDKSKYEHKRNYHVMNDGNYLMAIYEGKNILSGKIVRDFEIINMLEAGEQLKFSNRNLNALVKPSKRSGKGKNEIEIFLKATIRKGTMVLFYKKNPEEIWELTNEERVQRLYKVQKFDDRPWITLRFHQEARGDKEIKDEINSENLIGSPQLAIGLGKFNVLVEGYHFTLTHTGKIETIKSHAQTNTVI